MSLPPINKETQTKKNGAVNSRRHREWVAKHLCILFERKECEGPVDCCHARGVVSMAERAGMGGKPSDVFTVSMCRRHHRASEKRELAFGEEYGINIRAKCLEFARSSPDRAVREAAKLIKA